MQPYLNDPEFDPEFIRAKSGAAAGLCAWVRNIMMFFVVRTIDLRRGRQIGEFPLHKRVAGVLRRRTQKTRPGYGQRAIAGGAGEAQDDSEQDQCPGGGARQTHSRVRESYQRETEVGI